MKKFYLQLVLLLAACAVTANVNAQQQPGQGVIMKGVLLNAHNQDEKLAGANIIVEAASDTLATFSDGNGQFILKNVPRGNVNVKISYVGFTPYSLQLRADGTQIDFGNILLAEGPIDINEVTVVGQVQMMTARGDTIVYNPSAFQSVAGDYAIDLIVKFPGVEITDQGTIMAQGQEVKWALVDGRLMFGPDVMNTISNVKADDIEEVKVYDIVDPEKPGAEVMKEKDDMQRVMDFTTKSKFKGMLNIEILGGLGKDLGQKTDMTPDARYKGEFNLGKFSEKRIIMGDVLSNNTRENVTELVRGFMGGGRGTGYRGGGDGLGKRNRLDFHFSNYNPFLNRAKWQYNFHYAFTRNYDDTYSIRERIRLDNNEITRDTTSNIKRADEHTVLLHLRKRWSNANLSFTPIVSYNDGRNGSESWDQKSIWDIVEKRPELKQLHTISDVHENSFSTTGTMRFSQSFMRPEQKGSTSLDPMASMIQNLFGGGSDEVKRPPVTLNIDGGWKYSNTNRAGIQIETRIETENQYRTKYIISVDGKTRSVNGGVGVSGIYIYPWLTMKTNYAFDYTYSKNYQLYYDEDTWELDNTGRSGIFTRNGITNSMNANMSLGKNGAKVTGNVGLNYRIYRNMMNGLYPSYVNQGKTFQAFTPSVSVGSEQRGGSSLTSRVTWNVAYRTGTSDPSIEQLSEYVIRNSFLTYMLGNPNLKQSYTHTASASLRLQDENAATSFNFDLTANYTFNNITPQVQDIMVDSTLAGVVLPAGSTLASFKNVDGVRNLSFNSSVSTPFIGNKFILDGGLKYRVGNDAFFRDRYEIWTLSHTPSANIGLRSNHSATIEYGLTNRLSWQHTAFTNDFIKEFIPDLQNTRNLTNRTTANIKLRFFNNFVLAADYSYNYIIQHRGSVIVPTDNSDLLNASFSWEFAKRAAILRVTVYDILNGERGFSTSMDSQMITNSWKQLMGRYVMVTFSYRLNKLTGGNGESVKFQLPDAPPAAFGGAVRQGAVSSMGGANIPGIMK